MYKRFSLLVIACVVAVGLAAGPIGAIEVGNQAPGFELTDAISGETVGLADYGGKVILLDFFATWCGPCRHAIDEHLVPLYERHYKDDPNVVFFSIDIWESSISAQELQTFASDHNMVWPILMGSDTGIAEDYGIEGVPTICIIDVDRVIKYWHLGSPGSTTLKNEIDALLPKETQLKISPASFTLFSAKSTTLTATLTSNGSPVAGKTITWAATAGEIDQESGTTNSQGQVSVTHTAPTVDTSTPVTVSASFAGDDQRLASSDNSFGTIVKFQVTLTFKMSDGTPLVNTVIYYGLSSDQVTTYLGTTDNQGKIISDNSDFSDQTIYFKTSDGKCAGSSLIGIYGGEVTTELVEVSKFPLLWVVAAIVIVGCGAIGITILAKKR